MGVRARLPWALVLTAVRRTLRRTVATFPAAISAVAAAAPSAPALLVALFAFLPLLQSRALGLALIVRSVLAALRPWLTLFPLLLVRPLLTVSSILPVRPVAAPLAPAIAILIAAGALLAAAVAALAEAVALAAVAFLPLWTSVASRRLGWRGLRLRLARDIAREPPKKATEKSRLGLGRGPRLGPDGLWFSASRPGGRSPLRRRQSPG